MLVELLQLFAQIPVQKKVCGVISCRIPIIVGDLPIIPVNLKNMYNQANC